MKQLIFTSVLIISVAFNVFGQTDSSELKRQIRDLNNDVRALKNTNSTLTKKIEAAVVVFDKKVDSIQKQVSENTSNISITANKLGVKIDQSTSDASKRMSDLDNSISKNTLYWIVAFLCTALLSTFIYLVLRKKISAGNSALDKQIVATKKSLEEEGVRLDTKLTELLESQLKILSAERQATPKSAEEGDHALALKVADEIVRIEKNLSNMDANTKGLKQLAASIKRIQDNFEANGYEVADLLNKPYDPKMKVIVASSVPDETLAAGQEVITRIIKPQVNYRGIMIQSAQVEVSVGNN